MAKISEILDAKGHHVVDIDPDDTVFDAIARMVDQGVGSLIVRRGDDIEGIVTERDYLRKVALQGRSSRETPVRDVMSPQLVFATDDQEVGDALAIMTEARVRHLPVMLDGNLSGVISIGDCVKQVSRDRKARIRTLTDYIAGKYPG